MVSEGVARHKMAQRFLKDVHGDVHTGLSPHPEENSKCTANEKNPFWANKS